MLLSMYKYIWLIITFLDDFATDILILFLQFQFTLLLLSLLLHAIDSKFTC